MDETYIKVKGKWHSLYRVVDKEGKTIDFLLTKNQAKLAAKRVLIKVIDNNGVPEKNSVLGFKSFDSASITLNGIEIVHMLRKGQLAMQNISVQSLAETFYRVGSIVELLSWEKGSSTLLKTL